MPAAGNRQVRPLQGGIQIESRPRPGTIATGTLGLVIDKDGGQARFVTAGHVVGAAETDVGQPDVNNVVGKVQDNLLNDGADLVTVSVGVDAEVGRVWTGVGTYITVNFTNPGLPAENSTVVLQGSVSGNVTGTVLHAKADITEATTGVTVNSVVVVDYTTPTAPGGSGAPVLSNLQNGAVCYGVHGGSAKVNGKIVGWFTPFANVEL